MHYHGWNGIGGGYTPNYGGTFTTKTAAREWLKEEKDAYRDFAAEPSDDPVRVFGNVRQMTAVGMEGGMAFSRESFVEPCDDPTCELYADFLAGTDDWMF